MITEQTVNKLYTDKEILEYFARMGFAELQHGYQARANTLTKKSDIINRTGDVVASFNSLEDFSEKLKEFNITFCKVYSEKEMTQESFWAGVEQQEIENKDRQWN